MSQLPKLKYILSPDFHRRLLTKDLTNLNSVVPSNELKAKNEIKWTTPATKIISPLVRLNDAELIGLCMTPTSKFKTFKVEDRGKVECDNLKFVNGFGFIKWLKNYELENSATLKEVNREPLYNINLNDEFLESQCQLIIKKNDVAALRKILSETSTLTNTLIYILQHLEPQQHEIFQIICQHAGENNLDLLASQILTTLLLMSPDSSSLTLFNETFVPLNLHFTESFIDDLVLLNIKYDNLPTSLTYIHSLLANKLLTTHVTSYMDALRNKLESAGNNKRLNFNILTSGFGAILNSNLDSNTVALLLKFIEDRSEYVHLVSYIDNSAHKDEIYADLLNELIQQFQISLLNARDMRTLQKQASFTQFIKHLEKSFTNFAEHIDNELLFSSNVALLNWYLVHDLLVGEKVKPTDEIRLILTKATDVPEFVLQKL